MLETRCQKCQVLLAADVKYCSMCGAPRPDSVVGNAPVVKTKLSVLWLYLVGLAMFGNYASLFIPAFAGEKITPAASNGAFITTIVFFWLLWKRRDRTGWQGGLIGLAVGVFVVFVAGFIGGYLRSRGN